MTNANTRHHLAILEKLGLVVIAGQRPTRGRGRPANLYRLSETALGENYALLSHAILTEFIAELPPGDRQAVLNRVARRMVEESFEIGSIKRSHAGSGEELAVKPALPGLTQRLVNTIQILNKLSYQAHWEARLSAPEIILRHCPYAAILPQHPELCQLDAELLAVSIQMPVSQEAKLAHDQTGATFCLFSVGSQAAVHLNL